MGIELIPIILISIAIVWGVVLWIYTRLQIKAPTRKIESILLDDNHFVYSEVKEEIGVGKYSTRKYTLKHVPTGDMTYINRNHYSDCWWLTGDLSWMNEYEQDLIGSLINTDAQRKIDNYREACRIEKEARDQKLRELAKEKY